MSTATIKNGQGVSEEYIRRIYQNLGELRGLAQLVVYLADQIEETDKRLDNATDPTQIAFLNRVLSMYTQELESRNQGLTGRISAISQDVTTRVRPSLFRWRNG